ncbi:MFS transporter [Rugosimonospora africana]|uniref:Tetracycline resistance MFS efflux pump n=1 Tax=Rugosimonospora africana TaxID=556532 RepID=A0A8J3QY43_9ACTN|nr:MFS transporter [Rugosimonospora africana]GIH19545.1 tetracycline resistance MFS efflux pump [Rugosimonospora africana]
MRRSPALAFLLITVFIDMLGLGIVVPVVPALMTTITGHAASAAHWSGLIDASFGVTQFLASPFLGRLSDRYGRRPILILAMSFLGVDWLAHAIANTPATILAAHAAAGALGGTMTVINAYLADITEPADRPRAYGYVGAAFSAGFVAGPVLGGLLGGVSVRLPFLVTAGLAATNAAFGLLVLPESRPGDRRTGIGWRLANPFSAIASMLRRPQLRHLVIARLLGDIARMANQVMWVFVMVARFGWPTAKVGATLAVSSVIGAVVSARVSGPFVRWLGVRRASVVCSLAGAASLAGFGLVPTGWLIPPCMAVGAVSAIGGTASQSWISGLAHGDEHGTVQGTLTGISAIAETTVPVAATGLFAWSLRIPMPGLVLVAAAAFAVASAVTMSRSPRSHPAGAEPV